MQPALGHDQVRQRATPRWGPAGPARRPASRPVQNVGVAKDKGKKDTGKKDKSKKKSASAESAPPEAEESTRDEGSFTYGSCKSCEWRGRARRSRDKARSDAKDHKKSCAGEHKVKLKTTDHRD